MIDAEEAVARVNSANTPLKWSGHPNLRRRPHAPNKGQGRLQIQLRRAFTAVDSDTLSSAQIYDWTHVRHRVAGQRISQRHRHSVYRLLVVMCERVGRASTIGRPFLWKLRVKELIRQ
jgi:hypothetical protein